MQNPLIRSIVAVVAGFAAIAVLVMLTDAVMLMALPDLFPDISANPDAEPTVGGMLVNGVHGFIYAIVGGFVTARLAPSSPMKHVYVLVGLSVMFFVLSIRMYEGLFPAWYWVMLIAAGAVGQYLGGMLALRGSTTGVETAQA